MQLSCTGDESDVETSMDFTLASFADSEDSRDSGYSSSTHQDDSLLEQNLEVTLSAEKRKRVEPAHMLSPPIKKLRTLNLSLQSYNEFQSPSFNHRYSDSVITEALQRQDENENLIGDFSRVCSLPTIEGKHRDLWSIAPSTLAQYIVDDSLSLTVVDCRYPYEYQGGHIVGAKNLYTKELIMNEFLVDKKLCTFGSGRRDVIVFHCEFSSERGPKLLRFLRERDRFVNEDVYPALHYPEVYILEGGYKAFWEFCRSTRKNKLCEPNGYRLMLDEGFHDEMIMYINEKRTLEKRHRIRSNRKQSWTVKMTLF